jgi:hypothetical protein
MKEQQEKFLNLRTNPARLSVEETAWFLGFSPHEIPILVARGLLKPLGHPQPNTVKFFPAATVEELRKDVKWLGRATDVIMEHWRDKNARKTSGEATVSPHESTSSAHAVDSR